jgi:hypothetical protein
MREADGCDLFGLGRVLRAHEKSESGRADDASRFCYVRGVITLKMGCVCERMTCDLGWYI